MSGYYGYEDDAWQPWREAWDEDPITTEAQLIENAVAERAAMHDHDQYHRAVAESQQVAELGAYLLENELSTQVDNRYGQGTWQSIQTEWAQRVTERAPADVMNSPTELGKIARFVADEVIAERQSQHRAQEWDRVRASSPTPYLDSMTRRDAGG